MLTRRELAEGIRFAGERAAAAAQYVQDWDRQLAHQWTTRDAFVHVSVTPAALPRLAAALDSGALSALTVDQVAGMNAQSIGGVADTSKDAVIAAIRANHAAAAAYAESALDDADLATEVVLGGYRMPKGEVLAQVFIHHQIAHSYEASARWPL